MVRLRLADVVAPLHRRRLDRQRSDVQPHDGFLADHNPISLRHDCRRSLALDLIDPRRFRFCRKLHADNIAVVTNANIHISAVSVSKRHKRDNNVLIERRFELDRL